MSNEEAISKAEDLLWSDDPGAGYEGVIGQTLKDSTPWWRPSKQPPKGAPNVVVILLDDLGFSDFGCYGSEIDTPNIDRLAAHGMQMTGYTTVPMCTPARAALLTGKNPHSVGCGWLTHNNPGYPGYQAGEMSKDAPTMAELLRHYGYSTYAVGKWHNTADTNVSAAADRSAWPLQRGFDRFYGFLGAETNYHSPAQIVEGNELVPMDAYPEDYFCTDDWTEKACSYLRAHDSSCPDKPFFLYFATNAPHVPLHAKEADLAKYRHHYHKGWDQIRSDRFARQQELGIVGEDWQLPELSPGVPEWHDVPVEDRGIMSAYMELYAGLVDNIDQNVGAIIDQLEALGQLDNTLIMLTSDNGASSIGGIEGAANILEKRVMQNESPEIAKAMHTSGELGKVTSYPAYPVGWGNASNTPFRFYKRTPMNGGIRVPMIMHWPKGIAKTGINRDWMHVTDVLPTLLDILGQEYPLQFNGYRTRGLDGEVCSHILKDEACAKPHQAQHYELEGNRGYIDGDWKICSLQPPGQVIDLDNWLLFNLKDDPTEMHNLAGQYPDKLLHLIQAFDADAKANYVYPLDNRDLRKALSVSPEQEAKLNRSHRFYPHTETIHSEVVQLLIADRNFVLNCEFSYKPGDTGVLFALGDVCHGFTAYIIDAELVFAFSGGSQISREVRMPISLGEHRLRLDYEALGRRQAKANISLDSTQSEPVSSELNMTPTFLKLMGEGFDVGLDRRLKVTAECEGKGTFAYTNRINLVQIDPGAQAPGSLMHRAEAMVQNDW